MSWRARPAKRTRITRLLDQGGTGGSAVVGTGRRADPLTAALVNGMHSHVVELDDGHRYGIIHAGGPLIAGAGFPGPRDILDGPHGLVQMLRGSPANPTAFDVAAPYCIETVYLKPYASCRYCHAPVEAVLNLRRDHGDPPGGDRDHRRYLPAGGAQA